MAEKKKPVKKAAAPKIAAEVQERLADATAAEDRAHKDAQSGDQLARLAHYRALREFDAAEAAAKEAEGGAAADQAA